MLLKNCGKLFLTLNISCKRSILIKVYVSVLNVNVCFSKHKIFSLFDTISQCQWFERWAELWCRLKFVFRISREFVTPVICCHPNNNVVIIWFSILPSILYWTMSITWSCDSTCDTSFRIYSLRCMVEGIPLHCSLVTIRFDHHLDK